MAATMENVTISNIKLHDLIGRWFEVQKARSNYKDEHPLKVDVMDVTLLLKSMGLKLEYMDFQEEKSNTDTLTVEIKCHRSGVLAKMSYDLVNCSCPEKNGKETSFWEVQEISENCSMVSKAMLSNLLDYYRSSIKAIECGEDVLKSPLRVATPKILVTSPGDKNNSFFATPAAEGKFVSRTELVLSPGSKHENDPVFSPIKVRSLEELNGTSEQHQNDAKSNTSTDSVGIDNATREMSGNESGGEKPIISIGTDQPPVSTPGDASFANSDTMKALITSSPNETVFDSILNADQTHERDLNIIHCLQQARQQIDASLLIIKLNNPCLEPQQMSAILTTPQTVVRNSKPAGKIPERNAPAIRRMSLPGRPSSSPRLALGSTSTLTKKKSIGTSQLAASTSTSKPPATARGDTPRPTAPTVSLLRKASSSTSLTSTSSVSKSSSSVTVVKKSTTTSTTTTGIKPVGSVRPTLSSLTRKPGTSTSTAGRSVSAARADKKK